MNEPTFDQRRYIDTAIKKLGCSMEELAERLDYKSLRRIRNGEFPLPPAKRNHIEDLLRLHELENEKQRPATARAAEEPISAALPADIAAMDDEALTETLADMLNSYLSISAVFAPSARGQIAAVFREWLRRAEEHGRNKVTYSFTHKGGKGAPKK